MKKLILLSILLLLLVNVNANNEIKSNELKTSDSLGETFASKEIPLGVSLTYEKGFDNILEIGNDIINFQSETYNTRELLVLGQNENEVTVETSLTTQEDDYGTDVVLEIHKDAIKYYYAFDDTIDLTQISEENPLEIEFLGRKIKILEILSNQKFKLYVEEGVNVYMDLDENESKIIDNKNLIIKCIDDNNISVDIDGINGAISVGETKIVNGLEITIYSISHDKQSVRISIKQFYPIYWDGDAFIDEDGNDPDWIWDIGNLDENSVTIPHTGQEFEGPYFGIENDFIWNDDSDNPAGEGECISLPNKYLGICFDSLTVDDENYATYIFEYEASTDLSDVIPELTSAQTIHLHTRQNEGLVIDQADLTSINTTSAEDIATSNIWLYAEPDSDISIFYKDYSDNKVKLAGSVATNNDVPSFAHINYDNTKGEDIRLRISNENDLYKLELVPYHSINLPDYNDNISMYWSVSNGKFNSLGNTQYLEESDELTWTGTNGYPTTPSNIGNKDEDHRSRYGIIIRDPKSHGASDEVVLDLPGDQVQANIVVGIFSEEKHKINGNVKYYFDNEALKGISLELSDGNTIQTDENGYYEFEAEEGKNVTITPKKKGFTFIPEEINLDSINEDKELNFIGIMYGDVSGNKEVTPFDASLILQYAVGKINLTEEQIIAGDISLNGELTSYDASLILQYVVGKIAELPPMVLPSCTTPTDGVVITEDITFCPGTYELPNGIGIGADNVVLDCNDAEIKGNQENSGISVNNKNNIAIKNCKINNYLYGISLDNTNNSVIENNKIELNGEDGIMLNGANNIIKNNHIQNNFENGIGLGGEGISSNYNLIEKNIIENNRRAGTALISSNNNIIENNQIENNRGSGIYLKDSSGNTINSNNINYQDWSAISLRESSYNIITNNKFDFNEEGIYIRKGSNNIIDNNIVTNSLEDGITFSDTSNNQLSNTIISNSEDYDFYIMAGEDAECNHVFTNVIGTDNKPILYYNGAVEVSDLKVSELILCNADNSKINNIRINNENKQNNGLLMLRTENSLLSNITVDNSYTGIFMRNSDNNRLSHSSFTNTEREGARIWDSNNNEIHNSYFNNNEGDGIGLDESNNNIIESNYIKNNNWGISIGESNNNIIENNQIENNGDSGIDIWGANSNTIKNNYIKNNDIGISLEEDDISNLFYNNFFNNIVNVETDDTNNWNISKTLGTNIINGEYLGGNYWAKPDGTGFSQTCEDSNEDGICDSEYVLDEDNIDYLPLTYISLDTIPSTVNIISPENNSTIITDSTLLNVTTDEEAICSYTLVRCNIIESGPELEPVDCSAYENMACQEIIDYDSNVLNRLYARCECSEIVDRCHFACPGGSAQPSGVCTVNFNPINIPTSDGLSHSILIENFFGSWDKSKNTLTVTCKDLSNNVNKDSVTFFVEKIEDTIPPTIEIIYPENNSTVKSDTTSLYVETDENAVCEYGLGKTITFPSGEAGGTSNPKNMSITGSIKHYQLIEDLEDTIVNETQEEKYNIQVKCTDESDNPNSALTMFYVDLSELREVLILEDIKDYRYVSSSMFEFPEEEEIATTYFAIYDKDNNTDLYTVELIKLKNESLIEELLGEIRNKLSLEIINNQNVYVLASQYAQIMLWTHENFVIVIMVYPGFEEENFTVTANEVLKISKSGVSGMLTGIEPIQPNSEIIEYPYDNNKEYELPFPLIEAYLEKYPSDLIEEEITTPTENSISSESTSSSSGSNHHSPSTSIKVPSKKEENPPLLTNNNKEQDIFEVTTDISKIKINKKIINIPFIIENEGEISRIATLDIKPAGNWFVSLKKENIVLKPGKNEFNLGLELKDLDEGKHSAIVILTPNEDNLKSKEETLVFEVVKENKNFFVRILGWLKGIVG